MAAANALLKELWESDLQTAARLGDRTKFGKPESEESTSKIVVETGLEQAPDLSRKTGSAKDGSAKSSAIAHDSDLTYLVQSWPFLSANVKEVLMDLVRRTKGFRRGPSANEQGRGGSTSAP